MLPRIIILISLSVILVGVGVWVLHDDGLPVDNAATRLEIASATFACEGARSLKASFYTAGRAPAGQSGQGYKPHGSVHLQLSDGRSVDLDRTSSLSGTRYASQRGHLIFSNNGNVAYVSDNGRKTYRDCIEVAPDPGDLSDIYADEHAVFSIRYPIGYRLDKSYAYQGLGPGQSIHGVKFSVAPRLTRGTNLAADSYLSVELIPQAVPAACSANDFLPAGAAPAKQVVQNGVQYSVSTYTGAGAGNRYEEKVYALRAAQYCMAVRYFIHYSVLQNYPEGVVQAFDRQALLAQFGRIRRSLIVNRA